jgi:glyceraldehyde-3-phosphate dehydrogenase (NAD(P))
VVRVAINGYGTIGKRAADAVSAQDDMTLVGVTKRRPTFEAMVAARNGYPLYAADAASLAEFEKEELPVKGTLDDLLGKCDIVLDCTSEKVGVTFKEKYLKAGVKAIFQGGEKHEVAGVSFNAIANYEKALGAQFARVVSCNTTGLCRAIYPLHHEVGIEHVSCVLIRRAADPRESKKGPLNAVAPEFKLPSHHGPDVKHVIPDVEIETLAVKVPTTLMHVHTNVIRLRKEMRAEDVLDIWERYPRLLFVQAKHGIESTAQVMELARELGRRRADFYENVIWKDGVNTASKYLYFFQAIHQESIVVPEIVDCIRAMCSLETDKMRSIARTDKTLGIGVAWKY